MGNRLLFNLEGKKEDWSAEVTETAEVWHLV
jgi:hypothetical protein